MSHLPQLYRAPLGLLTDLYQLTMACAYWKVGRAEERAVFHLFFREAPFDGAFAVACGLPSVLELMDALRFSEDDLDYLASLEGNDGKPLFERAFLDALGALELGCDIDAVPEGTVVLGQEPLLRVSGPLMHCQLLETPLLTLVNFPTLVATKAARVCHLAAPGEPVLEFGLRRAQGIDGGVTAARAAYVGGCAGTSNVLAGRLFGIPVRGTHAHSWVMSFAGEEESFAAYAEAMPNNCTFLVDTFDTISGVHHAVEAGRELRRRGHEMVGVRLDSGDLAELSIEARRILDEGGFAEATIVASSDLDEYKIAELHRRGAKIGLWGVGTRLATAHDDPALGGVYKLSAIESGSGGDGGGDGAWSYRLKLSDEEEKSTNPGILQVQRRLRDGRLVADVIYDVELGVDVREPGVDLADPERTVPGGEELDAVDLLEPVVRGGRPCYDAPDIESVRRRTAAQLEILPPEAKRLRGAEPLPVGLEPRLHRLKRRLLDEVRATVERR
jgi:nicotinate phosphoribosyltransferase